MTLFGNDELLGALTATAVFCLCILVFLARLSNRANLEHLLGGLLLLTAIPLIYLLIRAPRLDRPALFYLQIALMLAYLSLEFVVDYWLHIDFRRVRWAVVCYVTLFFAATGGMIGIASLAGRNWAISSVVLFLTMTVLAFYQRAVTGM